MITQITFTGIDARTDIDRLNDIQSRYPFVEFGLLVAKSRQGNENRYPDLDILDRLSGRGLNLSCHVCGSLAREVILGATRKNYLHQSFLDVDFYLSGKLDMFRRLQLNVSTMDAIPEKIFLHAPAYLDEIIIQQHPHGQDILAHICSDSPVSVLFDASGGQGIVSPFHPVSWVGTRTGYAGGLNPENAADRIQPLLKRSILWNRNHWIDMESGVRTDDWFDLDKVEQVLAAVSPFIDKKAKRAKNKQ